MSSFNDGERCSICGSVISDTNTTGIGFGCMANVVKPAIRDCFREIKGLDLWKAKVDHVRSRFLQEFGGVKFRSDFKKSFFESMQQAERVSKKQLDIMINWLFMKRIFFNLYDEVEKPMRDGFHPSVECPELYRERISIHKKLYLSGKKDRHAEDIPVHQSGSVLS